MMAAQGIQLGDTGGCRGRNGVDEQRALFNSESA